MLCSFPLQQVFAICFLSQSLNMTLVLVDSLGSVEISGRHSFGYTSILEVRGPYFFRCRIAMYMIDTSWCSTLIDALVK
jgi:hypothetical protein